MKVNFNDMTRKFLLGEGKKQINPHALLQALQEALSTIRPSTMAGGSVEGFSGPAFGDMSKENEEEKKEV